MLRCAANTETCFGRWEGKMGSPKTVRGAVENRASTVEVRVESWEVHREEEEEEEETTSVLTWTTYLQMLLCYNRGGMCHVPK